MADLEYDRTIEAEVADSLNTELEGEAKADPETAADELIESFGSEFPPELREVLTEAHVAAITGAIVLPVVDPTD